MTISHVTPDTVALAAEQNALIDQSNATTSLAARNQADIAELQNRPAPRSTTQADDTLLYGDVISNIARSQAWYSETVSNGYLTAVATISPKTFAATELRICVNTPAEGADTTFDIKLLTGQDVQSLSERYFGYGPHHVTSAGLTVFPLDNIAITTGDAVAISFVVTDSTTAPTMASTAFGPDTAILIGAGTSVYSTFESGQSYPIPSSIDMTDTSWTRAANQYWFALT